MKYIKENDLIDFILIKLFLFIFHLFFILKIQNKIIDENYFEKYFSLNLCKLLDFKRNYNCSYKILTNKDFYDDIIGIIPNTELLINIKNNKIEIIILLIGIMPFLKNSSIIYKINDKEIHKLFKFIYENNKNLKNRKIIKINENDFILFNDKIEVLFNYNWELIPELNILNNLRYIINNYYNESCLDIFDKLLNLNFKYYIKRKKKSFSIEEIKKLMSKKI